MISACSLTILIGSEAVTICSYKVTTGTWKSIECGLGALRGSIYTLVFWAVPCYSGICGHRQYLAERVASSFSSVFFGGVHGVFSFFVSSFFKRCRMQGLLVDGKDWICLNSWWMSPKTNRYIGWKQCLKWGKQVLNWINKFIQEMFGSLAV